MSDRSPALRVRLLGSGTSAPSASRGSAGTLLRSGARVALVDCGPGTKDRLATAGARLGEVEEILLTHLHLDHTLGLFSLLFYRLHPDPRDLAPLRLSGPTGFSAWIEGAADALYPGLLARQGDIVLRDIAAAEPFDLLDLVGTSCRADHAEPSLSYRLESPTGAVVVLSGDTGPDSRLAELSAGADLLICDCSFPDGSPVRSHLTPNGVRHIADRARPRTLCLSHIYPALDVAGLPGAAFADYAGEVVVGRDQLEFVLPA